MSENNEEQIPKEKADKHNIIEILHKIQEEDGFLSEPRLEKVSLDTGIPLSKIFGIITFYSYFKLNKAAANIIQICDGTACHVRGSEKLMDEVKDSLGIPEGQMTEDGKFSHEVVRCLGMCASAPLIKINEDVYPKLSPSEIKEILQKYS